MTHRPFPSPQPGFGRGLLAALLVSCVAVSDAVAQEGGTARPAEEEAAAELEVLRGQVAEAAAEAKLALAEASGRRRGSAELADRRGELESLVERAGAVEGATPAALESLLSGLAVATVRVQQAAGLVPASPPAEVRAAAAAYFRGEYRRALGLLATASPGAPAERAQGHLFAAAARFALARRGEADGDDLLAAAGRDAAAARRLDPDLEPDPRAFSPAFLAFFREAPGG